MYKEDGLIYLEDHDYDVLNAATFEEAKHRLANDSKLLWEALGVDALPNDLGETARIESEIALALVSDRYEELGRLLSNLALEYVFKCCHEEILSDWEDYIDNGYEE